MDDTTDEKALSDLRPYAEQTGWLQSRKAMRPIRADGSPLPWYTYSAISFLERCVPNGVEVFEFGTGNSTLWWAKRAASVTTVEHNTEWAEEIRLKIPTNVSLSHIPLVRGGVYCKAAIETGGRFDIIVIDGKDRWRCTMQSLAALKDDAVFVWDNSNVPGYQPLFERLRRSYSFKRLPFFGHGPMSNREWETSILYRRNNCFGI